MDTNKMDFLKELMGDGQCYVNKILDAINPISGRDLPLVVFALRSVSSSLENAMDERQRRVVVSLSAIFGVEDMSEIHERKACDTEDGE